MGSKGLLSVDCDDSLPHERMSSIQAAAYELEQEGYTILQGIVSDTEVKTLIDLLQSRLHGSLPEDKEAGIRLDAESLAPLVTALSKTALSEIIQKLAGPATAIVRAILFDKTPECNWSVPWHQDFTIAVAEKRETAGFVAWSNKAGGVHVQPPQSILENMLTARIHLDPAPASNGALRVISGSHLHGRLGLEAIAQMRANGRECTCEAKAGDVLLMRPLLLHSSADSLSPACRRVLHLECAAFELPNGLRWRDKLAWAQ